MTIYLVRHAHAGQPRTDGRDRYRTLSPLGRERAEQLAVLLAGRPVDRLWSSPYTRCLQTMGPLARSTGAEIVERDVLQEGADTTATLAELTLVAEESVVACSHGDVIPAVIDQVRQLGADVIGRGCELGSVWILDGGAGSRGWYRARYHPATVTELEDPDPPPPPPPAPSRP